MAIQKIKMTSSREVNCELYTAELIDRGLLEQMEDEREYGQHLYPESRGCLDLVAVVEGEDDF